MTADSNVNVVRIYKDSERLDFLEKHLFERHWDGTIGRPPSWRMVGHYRHILQKMQGRTLREALDGLV